ncbi:MAG: hypothetical protein CM15mP93_16150 [Thiotrichaceae bacterium]|nr:MAG: hypothetical protein CM15mP93_16150 [Thiotrichaceae bacterium]
MSFYEKILKSECKVIDLSADFRIKNTNTWEKFYNLKHCVLTTQMSPYMDFQSFTEMKFNLLKLLLIQDAIQLQRYCH